MERQIRANFSNIYDAFLNNPLKEDRRDIYMQNDLRLFVKYYNNLKTKFGCKEIKNLDITIMCEISEMIKNYRRRNGDVLAKRNACQVMKAKIRQYMELRKVAKLKGVPITKEMKDGYRNLERLDENAFKEYKASLAILLQSTGENLSIYELPQELLRREKISLMNLGVSGIIQTDDVNIGRDFSAEKNINSPEIELLAKNIFWINKLIKCVSANQSTLLLVENKGMNLEEYRGEETSGKDKSIALNRLDILNSFYRSYIRRSKGIEFSSFLKYLESMGEVEKYIGEISHSEEDERQNRSQIEQGSKIDKRVIRDYREIEGMYNQLFDNGKGNIKSQFLADCALCNNYLKFIQDMYIIKDNLTAFLMVSLVEKEKESFSSSRYNWGVVEDSSQPDYSEKKHILIVDLPGHIKPLQVHVPDRIIDKFNQIELPQYRGVFGHINNRELSNNFMFRLNAEQMQKLKERYKQAKKSNNDQGNEVILLHMDAMARGEFFKVPDNDEVEKAMKDKRTPKTASGR